MGYIDQFSALIFLSFSFLYYISHFQNHIVQSSNLMISNMWPLTASLVSLMSLGTCHMYERDKTLDPITKYIHRSIFTIKVNDWTSKISVHKQ